GERERRPGGGEDMHGKGACLDERGQFGLHFACTYRPDSSEARVTISRFEVVVVGGGPAGLTAAIALAGAGIATALVAKSRTDPDHRTTALLAGSGTALDTLGVWQRCQAHAAPLRVLRLVDDTGRLVRAPEVSFAASEIGLDAFGHNIENRLLIAALEGRAREGPHPARIEGGAAPASAEAERGAMW